MNTPPFLLGAAILFWGWLGGNLLTGAVLAVAFEAARFIGWRVDLSDAQQRRVADVTTILAFGAGVVFYATTGFPRAAVLFFEWLPVLLLPIALLQAYGSAPEIDLRVLFWSLRRRPPREFNTVNLGYPYLILWVIAASASPARGPEFDAGLVAILAWALWPLRARGRRLAAWIGLVGIAAAIGYAGGAGLRDLQLWIEGAAPEWIAGGGTKVNPYRGTTDIGRLGQLKLSEAIVLRVRSEAAFKPPLLLHQASYNDYQGVNWIARGGSFSKLPVEPGGRSWRLADGAAPLAISIAELARQGDPVLSLPRGAKWVTELDSPSLRRNPLGAVQGETLPGFITYRIAFDPESADRDAPTPPELAIPKAERETLERLAREWGLVGLAPQAAVDEVRRRFLGGFEYATFQQAPRGSATPLADFLLRTHTGHCELFASATTLLLRAAGVPARYATGYSLQEWSDFEGAWIARERHSHAWSRAFIGGKWIDVDNTPPVWIELEAKERPAWGALSDAWSWARYRFDRWLGAASTAEKAIALGAPILLVLLAFAWRATRALRAATLRPIGAPRAAAQAPDDSGSEFSLVIRHLERLSLPRHPAETVREWIARIAPRAPGDARELSRLAELHYRLRFDPAGLPSNDRAELAAGAARWVRTG